MGIVVLHDFSGNGFGGGGLTSTFKLGVRDTSWIYLVSWVEFWRGGGVRVVIVCFFTAFLSPANSFLFSPLDGTGVDVNNGLWVWWNVIFLEFLVSGVLVSGRWDVFLV